MRRCIRWFAGLQVAQGLLEVVLGGLSLIGQLLDLGVQGAPDDIRGLAVALAATVVASGLLRICAGVFCWMVRGRSLGIISLVPGLASSFMCCPFGLMLLVFGLVLYLNADVIEAFELRASGASADDALRGRADIDALAAVFDPDVPSPGPLAERRVLDTSIVEALVVLLPDSWTEAYVDLTRSPRDSSLQVVIRDASHQQEITPDAHLLDTLGALDEFGQASDAYLKRATLHVWEDRGWHFKWL